MMHCLTAAEVARLHALIVCQTGGGDGVRDFGLVDSAVARPQAAFTGQEAYPTVWHKAAVLLHSLVNNRAFLDGNKRTAIAACAIFLERNGQRVDFGTDQAIILALQAANSEVDEKMIAGWLQTHSVSR